MVGALSHAGAYIGHTTTTPKQRRRRGRGLMRLQCQPPRPCLSHGCCCMAHTLAKWSCMWRSLLHRVEPVEEPTTFGSRARLSTLHTGLIYRCVCAACVCVCSGASIQALFLSLASTDVFHFFLRTKQEMLSSERVKSLLKLPCALMHVAPGSLVGPLNLEISSLAASHQLAVGIMTTTLPGSFKQVLAVPAHRECTLWLVMKEVMTKEEMLSSERVKLEALLNALTCVLLLCLN